MQLSELTVSPVCVDIQDSLETAARAFTRTEGRQLPVLCEGAPCGVVRREDIDDQGVLRGSIWMAWGRARTVRELVRPVPVIDALETGAMERALTALLEHACVLIRISDEVFAIFTEHDGVRIALERSTLATAALPIATAPPRTIGFDAPGECAVRTMNWHHTRHLLVMDDGELLGVISERDLSAEGIARGRQLTVGEVWRERPLIAVPKDASICEVALRMLEHHVGCVPLLDDARRAVAVLTRRDLVRFAVFGETERRATAQAG